MLLCRGRGQKGFGGLGSLMDVIQFCKQNNDNCSENDSVFKYDFHSNCV